MLRKKFLLKQEEWSQEHETAFKSMMRKSHSVNSMAKTRRFRELERSLPHKRTFFDKEWRYDLHSPWVNDLDFHDKQYFTFDLDTPQPKKHTHISNIRVSGAMDEPEEIDQQEVLETDMRELTGVTRPINEYTLKARADRVRELRRFEDAKKGYELIYKWEKSKSALEKDEAELAAHVIKDLHGDMKQMTKARYSYLSAKIAKQRAKAEITKKMMAEAEYRRTELRKRQVEFQRQVGFVRIQLGKLYGKAYLKPRRRVIENTSHPLGSPLFLQSMVALGFLPNGWEPKPKRLTPGAVKIVKFTPPVCPPESSKYLSKVNFDGESTVGKSPSEKLAKERRRQRAAVIVQSWFRGARVRRFTRKYQHGVKVVQRWYKRRLRLVAMLAYILRTYLKTPKRVLFTVISEFRDTGVFRAMLKKHPVLAAGFLKRRDEHVFARGVPRRTTLRTLNFYPTYEACKELQATVQRPLVVRHKTVAVTQQHKKVTLHDLPSARVRDYVSPKTPDYHQAKTVPTMSDEEATVILRRINQVRVSILETRTEMWKYFLSSVQGRAVDDSSLAGLLAKDSLYAKKAMGSGVERLTWEGSGVKVNMNQPVVQTDLRLVSPQTVRGR